MRAKVRKVQSLPPSVILVLATILFLFLFPCSYSYAVKPQVATGMLHTVGLKSDGTVVAVGDNSGGQLDVGSWTDIVQVDAGGVTTVGLKSDGRVVATGLFGDDTSSWTDIVQVAVGGVTGIVGLKSNGTVVTTGLAISSWTDIVQVDASDATNVGLKSDGRVVGAGHNEWGQLNVDSWTDIVQVATGVDHTVGLKSDGTAVAVGYEQYGALDVESWSNIVQVAAGLHHTLGLKSDGRVVGTGVDYMGTLGVGSWRNIVQISTSDFHTVGLKSDGTVVAGGYNANGQCNIRDWNLGSSITPPPTPSDETGSIGSQITMIGPGFGFKKGKILIGETATKILDWSDASVTYEIKKPLPPGVYDVVLRLKEPKGVDPITYREAFTMMSPEITLVNPASGTEGTSITISGNYFGIKKGKVYLGEKKCKVSSWAMDKVTFIVPKKLVPGVYSLTVTNKVSSDDLTDGFTIE